MKPVLQALLLADHIYEDRMTGKRVIAGIFNRLRGRRHKPEPPPEAPPAAEGNGGAAPEEPKPRRPLPGPEVGSPYVYISLTEIYRPLRLQLRYMDLDGNAILFSLDLDITTERPNPLQTMELTVPLPRKLPIPHAGAYALELCHDGEVLGSLRILVDIED